MTTCIQRPPLFRGHLFSEVTSIQGPLGHVPRVTIPYTLSSIQSRQPFTWLLHNYHVLVISTGSFLKTRGQALGRLLHPRLPALTSLPVHPLCLPSGDPTPSPIQVPDAHPPVENSSITTTFWRPAASGQPPSSKHTVSLTHVTYNTHTHAIP